MLLPAFTRKQLMFVAGGAVAIIIVLLIFGLKPTDTRKPVRFEIWTTYEEYESFKELIEEYEKANKYVSIIFKRKAFADYEKDLVNAFAEDKEPNIWLIHNTWLPKHKDKISSLPTEVLAFNLFREEFVDVAEIDLTENEEIYGLPLYIDSLALFYNKDFLNSAGISFPPETWEEVIDALDILVVKNKWGGIERAGLAMGTAENINRSTDILALLMLQNGTQMVSEDKKIATFSRSISLEKEAYYPGRDALRFYTDFSNPSKRTYTWNRQMPYSVDAFVEGKTAMMINYSHHVATIRNRAPYLNFGVASMPQIKGREFDINYANYWAFTVSKNQDPYVVSEAWKFIVYLVSKDNAQKYLEKARKPTARRDLVDWQKDDSDLGVFAKQSLTARSWYQIDSDAIETIFAEIIKSIVLGTDTVNRAIEKATSQVTLLMKQEE